MKKIAIISAALAMTGLSATAPTATVAQPTVDTQNTSVQQAKGSTNKNNATLKTQKVTRLTSTRRAGYWWLTPTNKESFKQSRRKQLAKKSKRKAKKNGQA